MTQPKTVASTPLNRLKNKASVGSQSPANPTVIQMTQDQASAGIENFGKHCFSRVFIV